jgi:CelD/BcsL family acetyltransferase involved in cellulose biosynthesis
MLDVSLNPLQSLEALEIDWRAIESSGHVSFFQSWDWIGSLLETLPLTIDTRVLRVFAGRKLVALGLLWRGAHWRRKILFSRTLHLNETGHNDFDVITLEHNGLLTIRGFESMAVDAVLDHLKDDNEWDELYLGGLTTSQFRHWADAASNKRLWVLMRFEKPFFYIDLEKIRINGTTYLESLSRNTRYQARRALRSYSTNGALGCQYASSAEEAHVWFGELVTLHQSYWISKGEPGAFSTDFARKFHTAVITKGWPRGTVKIVRLVAGANTLGYLYNFCLNGVLYNYQSGHISEKNPKVKTGLVCHCLVVDDAIQRGFAAYDLLMGGGHFKSSLTNASGDMIWSVIQQRRLTIGFENVLRRSRDFWRSISGIS